MANPLNKVQIEGNLAADAKLTDNEKVTVLNFTVAVNRSYKDRNDEWQSAVDYVAVKVFNDHAKELEELLKKGVAVKLTGSLRQNSFTVDNQTRYELFVLLTNKKNISIPSVEETETTTEQAA